LEKAFIDQHPQAIRAFATGSAKAADWVAAHPDEARKLVGRLLTKRGEDPAGAAKWSGYSLRPHALYTDHDTAFWLGVLVREGKLKPDQFNPKDIATNRYNGFAESPG
jgi:ABC-type nitrate/sulfonate/bicarbonate transport system substrate-binding protein